MKLKDFIKRYVCPNTLIRLWKPVDGGHKMICPVGAKEVCMEWEISKNKCWQSQYKVVDVIGVTDIITESNREAVNIVLDIL